MKRVHQTSIKSFAAKNLFLFLYMSVFSSFCTICSAQSVVGKWKEISGKNYFSAAYAKKTGKSFVNAAPQMGGQVLNLKADHSFTSTELMNWVPSQMDLTGTWTLSNNILNTILNAVQPDPKTNPTKEASINNYTISWSGNNLILSFPIQGNPVMEKMEKTYTKL